MGRKIHNFKSLESFKKTLDETHTLIHALDTQVVSTRELLKFTKAERSPEYIKFKKYLEVSDDQISKLYELGFVALFANFECFMFELLKELYYRYPTSFQPEKIAKYEDIKEFANVEEIKDYFIDSVAIEKSQDITAWSNLVSQSYKIKIFQNKKELERLVLLNLIRNISLHSGGKTNSKFSKHMSRILKVPVPIGKSHSLDMKKNFHILYGVLCLLVKNIEKK